MPAKGKHRRTTAQRFTRSIAVAVAGTGGAALALPLLGATGAHAATGAAAPEKAVQSVSVVSRQATAEKGDEARTYTVKAGDYLAKIAEAEHIDGGWKQLYADNREAVGADPALIHPGLKLSIDGAAVKSAPKQSSSPEQSSPAPAKPAAPKAAKPAAKAAEQPAEQSSPEATAQNANASAYSSPVPGAGGLGTAYKVAGSMWSSGYHTGVDFSVPTGTSLKAVGAGTVVSAGWGGAYGNQVVVKLNDGYYAQYAHLSSLSVSAGQSVTAGQQVGLSGATGNVTGPHLHFEIRTTPNYGSDVDPVSYLRSKGVSIG
ncbi:MULTISPECIES: LysM peptidoglycan-binding domain-containing M23 family metallopeptidase [Streptomyces]|uniref:LysM peptidoglycan-binding domain-containing M23 family metallopeptidase n=1 Tax=Streptomyces edwardsiae TaxID=3075527 RepID=A0ABU2Q3R7_9ACTN|nr:LysM peptidoglycan-binding domain-containing M23 family metallopeptidase [Streptomyces sp. DSM 41636]MDT0398598.1 LysM peptidoglycan-binding domain-containing M23 family metallopeptidase [Streptomyces sp. DSM 41636]